MTIDLRQSSVTELKAMAYDLIGQLERTQQTLQTLNAEIARRAEREQEAMREVSARVPPPLTTDEIKAPDSL